MTEPDYADATRVRNWLAMHQAVNPTADDLAAWAEGRLDATRAVEVELALAKDAALRRAVRAWQQPVTVKAAPPEWYKHLFALLARWQPALVPTTAALTMTVAAVAGIQLGEGLARERTSLERQQMASLLGSLMAGGSDAN